MQSMQYEKPFKFGQKGIVKTLIADISSGKTSPVKTTVFDIPTEKWKIVKPTAEQETKHILDGDEQTVWSSGIDKFPADLIVDLGETQRINGFAYTPDQRKKQNGIVFTYQFFVSTDGKNWGKPVSKGEFSNIQNSPVKQEKTFEAKQGRYVKFSALSTTDEQKTIGIAEFSVQTD